MRLGKSRKCVHHCSHISQKHKPFINTELFRHWTLAILYLYTSWNWVKRIIKTQPLNVAVKPAVLNVRNLANRTLSEPIIKMNLIFLAATRLDQTGASAWTIPEFFLALRNDKRVTPAAYWCFFSHRKLYFWDLKDLLLSRGGQVYPRWEQLGAQWTGQHT